MSANTLPGIVKIEMIHCSGLQPHLMQQALCGVAAVPDAPATEIHFFGKPSFKWEGSLIAGARVEKSTLEFKTRDVLPEGQRLAFIVTAASGLRYLIGTREPRYPQIAYSDTVGVPGGDAALRTYKITHTALKSVLPCI